MSDSEEAISLICEAVHVVARKHGAVWCKEADAALRQQLCVDMGGAQFYVPRQSFVARKERNEQIVARFNGHNIRDLAREFRTSERTVRRILTSRSTAPRG